MTFMVSISPRQCSFLAFPGKVLQYWPMTSADSLPADRPPHSTLPIFWRSPGRQARPSPLVPMAPGAGLATAGLPYASATT